MKGFAFTSIVLVSLILACAGSVQAQQGAVSQSTQAAAQESPLTNADVVKLCKLGLGDDVVVAKINQAKSVNFDLGTDALGKLKDDGVSKDVIAAMLRRTSPPPAQSAPASTGFDVRLLAKSGDIQLKGRKGEASTTFAFVTALVFIDYPGAASDTRTTDPRPAILARLNDTPKASLAFIVKTNPDKKKDIRSLKVGKRKMFSAGGWSTPDEDWTLPFDATEEAPGLWRLTPKADLKPGEYGLYVQGQLYDFGVDK
ncbi:MAG: hypothetical protein ABR961_12025 [Thermoanaerobaculaceae bacterium]|jgi:hypothetical protein